jgi:tRNA(Arg) A34 adenosine deaminase TadA
MNDTDHQFLVRCVDLAERALELGNSPFGSVLVDGAGQVLAEDHNREDSDGDNTLHPEFELARWAARNMTAPERAMATVYTSGEHCPMCSAAHAWVGLGRIVYALSSTQLAAHRTELGAAPGPVRVISIGEVAPDVPVDGPDPLLEARLKALHKRRFEASAGG